MDFIYLSVIGSLVATFSVFLIFIYLYVVFRERFMGIWVLSWLILFSKYAFFDSGMIAWKNNSLFITIYLSIVICSTLLFVWGIHIFINRPFRKWWIYAAVSFFLASAVLNTISISLMYKLLIPIYVCCLVGIWCGVIFIFVFKQHGIGRFIVGYAFIGWSLNNFLFPLHIYDPRLLSWGYALGGILRLCIAVGTLIVYFEKTRTDLTNKEVQYRKIAENAIDVIYHCRLLPEVVIEYINPSIVTLTGYTPEEFYTDPTLLRKIIYPEDRTLLDDYIRTMPQSFEAPLTARFSHKNNSVLWIEQKCVPIYDEEGKIIALEGIIRDITHRIQMEKLTSSMDRMTMVGSMAATVAHEIRNPMTTVRGYLQLLESKKLYQADKDKFQLMIEELDRANQIIREYLSLSREKMSHFSKVSLNQIIEALFPLLQADGNASNVLIILALDKIPDLLLDENEIRQLLINLVRNGMEAMPYGGKLIIQTFQQENEVVLSVQDHGPGIPTHILEHVGTPFFTTKDFGTGLGLPLCYQIAHRHHATIKIHTSECGTAFKIHFLLQ